MRIFGKIFKSFLLIIFCCLLCGTMFAGCYVFSLPEWQAFDASIIPAQDETLYILDKNDQLVCKLNAGENRKSIALEELTQNTINAFLAAEDARFYSHNGIDTVRIFGAFIADLKSGTIKQGASTITQQLMKILYLKNDQLWERKVQEALMAMEFEKVHTKSEILTMYLNKVYFGNGAYGIEEASQCYFGKHAAQLSLPEAATLAGILKAPSTYAPHIDPEKSLYRRNTILNQMAACGYITESERCDAVNTPLTIIDYDASEYPYGYYLDMVLADAEEKLHISTDELLRGGYVLHTTLDTDIQSATESVYANNNYFPANAADGTAVQSACVVLNNADGSIAAVIGGREHTARRILNRATSTRRNPGSTIKPIIVYAPALETGEYTTTSFILDEQESFNGFTPSNAGGQYHGWVTLRFALAHSLNLPAIKVLNEISPTRGMEYAARSGIPFNENDAGLTLALGGFTSGVTPLELAESYSVFATGGKRTLSYCIRNITDQSGNVLYEHQPASYHILSSATAFLITDMLRTCAYEGTAKNAYVEGVDLAAKTGTSSYGQTASNQDAWIVAYDPQYTMCCWMGYDQTDDTHVLDTQDTGGNYPAKIANALFSQIYQSKPAPVFSVPDDILTYTLDQYALEEKHELRLSLIREEDEHVQTEYYKKGTQPQFIAGSAPS